MQIEWTNNNPEILEILESDGYSCTIRALAPGAASVSGGFGPYAKSLDITVRDPGGSALPGSIRTLQITGPGRRSSPPSRRASSAEPAPTPSPRRPPLTQGQLVTVLHRLAGTPEATGSSFQDVVEGPVLHRGRGMGQGNRPGEGRYPRAVLPQQPCRPGSSSAAILYRYAQLQGQDVSNQADLSAYLMPGSSAIMPSPPWHGL